MNVLREGLLVFVGIAVAIVVAWQTHLGTDRTGSNSDVSWDEFAPPTNSATVPMLEWSAGGNELLGLVRGGETEDHVSVVSTTTSQELYHYDAAPHSISTAALLPGKLSAVIGFYDGSLTRVGSDSAGEHSLAKTSHNAAPSAMAVSPDGLTLAVAFEDCSLVLFDLVTGRELDKRTRFFDRKFCSLRFAPGGLRLVAASQSGRVAVLVARRLRTLREFDIPGATLRLAAFTSPDRIVTVGFDGTLRLWDLRGAKVAWQSPPAPASTPAADVSPDGRYVALGSFDASITLWDLKSRQAVHLAEGHEQPVLSLGFSPDGTKLASGSLDGTIRLWQVATGTSQVLADFSDIAGNE